MWSSLPIVLCERSHHVHVGGERIWDLRALSAAARLRSPHTTKTQNKTGGSKGWRWANENCDRARSSQARRDERGNRWHSHAHAQAGRRACDRARSSRARRVRGAIDGTVTRTRKRGGARISPDLIRAPSDLAPLFGSRASFHHPFPSHDTFSTYKASLLSPSIRSQMTQHMSPMRQTPFAISSE